MPLRPMLKDIGAHAKSHSSASDFACGMILGSSKIWRSHTIERCFYDQSPIERADDWLDDWPEVRAKVDISAANRP